MACHHVPVEELPPSLDTALKRHSSISSLAESEPDDYFQETLKSESIKDIMGRGLQPAGLYEGADSEEALEKLAQDLVEYDKNESDDMYLKDETLEPRGYDFKVDQHEQVKPVGIEEDEFIAILKRNVAKLFPPSVHEEMVSFFLEDCDTLLPKHALDIGKMQNKYTGESVTIDDFGFDKDAKVRSKPYKLDPNSAKIAEEMLDDMVKHGILEPGASEFFSSVFLIPKGNSAYRLVTGKIIFTFEKSR